MWITNYQQNIVINFHQDFAASMLRGFFQGQTDRDLFYRPNLGKLCCPSNKIKKNIYKYFFQHWNYVNKKFLPLAGNKCLCSVLFLKFYRMKTCNNVCSWQPLQLKWKQTQVWNPHKFFQFPWACIINYGLLSTDSAVS